jgi:protein-histidine N-methyltransferase
MAEDEGDADGPEGLGDHDVKTGVYEGGFKSWESSVDLVKVLATGSYGRAASDGPLRVVEVRLEAEVCPPRADAFQI